MSMDNGATFNVNENVWVRLTDVGRNALRENHYRLYAAFGAIPDYVPRKEEDGWSRWQLWELMRELGSHITMGAAVPFDTTIRIDASALKPTAPPNPISTGKAGG